MLGRRLWVSLTALALLGAVPAAAQDATHRPAREMRPVAAAAIRIDGTRLISMSPDGLRLVAWREGGASGRGELCTFDIATLREIACADLSAFEAGVRLADVTWSPDSRWLALAESSFETWIDGDLWIMDASTGALRNLLDDGYRGPLPVGEASPGTITLATNPAFTPEGRGVTFSRSWIVDGEPRGNDIATVPVAGGEPQRLVVMSDDSPGVVVTGIGWAPDGAQLYLSESWPDPDDPRDGVWVADADGGGLRQLLGRYHEGRATSAPSLLQVAADGGHVLVYDRALVALGSLEAPAYATVRVADGMVTPLEPLGPDAGSAARVVWAGFSPDGGAPITVQGPAGLARVAVRDVDGVVEHPLGLTAGADEEPVDPGPTTLRQVPCWAPNGRVLLTRAADASEGVVLTIEGSRSRP